MICRECASGNYAECSMPSKCDRIPQASDRTVLSPTDVVWADPIESRGRPSSMVRLVSEQVVDLLMGNPVRFASIKRFPGKASSASGVALRIRRGKILELTPAGHWETKGVTDRNGGSELFLRYVGPKETE